jgi:hypothetical protein
LSHCSCKSSFRQGLRLQAEHHDDSVHLHRTPPCKPCNCPYHAPLQNAVLPHIETKAATAAPKLCNARHPSTTPLRERLVTTALDCTLRARLHRPNSPATYDCTETVQAHCTVGELHEGSLQPGLQARFCSGAARAGSAAGLHKRGSAARLQRAPSRLQTLVLSAATVLQVRL